jgi:thiosulfate/3-mercaptopyruvate sulfurtransferase
MAPVNSPLISADLLTAQLAATKVFDLRWSLTDPDHGRRAYEAGHIPGAVFVDLDRDLSASEGDGRHPLPPIADFVETLGRLGLDRHDDVVIYDDASGTVAARMWWMLGSIGHGAVRVLDGGIDSWVKGGLLLERGRRAPEPTTYPAVPGFTGVVRHHQLAGRLVADVRAPERYRGDVEPVDPKAGHIPGAVNYPTVDNLEGGMLRSGEALARRYASFPEDGVVSCGSGVNACHAALALVLAGRPMPDVYIGSFSDWSRRDLPVKTGPNP